MSTNHLSCCSCNRKSEIFRYLTNDELELVDKHRTEVQYKPGEIIVKQGSPVTHVISFSSGLAKVSIEGNNQKNLILRFLTPTQFIGGPGLYVDRLHHFSVTALEPSRVCFIDFSVFKQLIRKNCDFADAFIKYISKEGIFDYDRFISLTQKHMHGRIADALIYLDKEVFCSKDNGIRISRNDLAEFTGMSADSAIRILKQMTTDNIVETKGRTIHILDLESLKRISQIG
ncbi:MAG: Crp/Fnr family transcriptional regulator [Bacteroidales bacterium]|nr:Crp/Fnr family transcriptional regulator [Bacteroidales bacterium]